MRKFIYISCLIMLLLIISGCGKDKTPNPSNALDSYITKWTEEDFESMYPMLTQNARDEFDSDYFTERYEKLYTDLDITDIKITPSTLSEEDEKQAIEQKETTFNLQVSLNSLAGPIKFKRDIHLELIEFDDDTESEWQINWEEGLIFPGLENGGKVTVEREKPRRGEILDRNQMPLAINGTAYEVGVVPSWMENEENEISELARILSLSENQIEEQLNASWVQADYFVPLKTIPRTAEKKLNELNNIPGASTKETTGRNYPLNEAAAHLTGYIGTITKEEMESFPEGTYHEGDLVGKRGLEQLYEEQLHGKEGIKILIVTEEDEEKQEEVLAETPVEDGKNIHLSIDVNIQEKIFNAYGKETGTSSAIDPKTGEVLALVSSPAFNPNEFIYGISQSKWEELSEDPKKPLLNRFTATFAPGSVLKPITAAIGLKNGAITHNEGIEINGLTWGKKGWGDVVVTRVSTTEKPVDLKLALTKSDNIYFAMKAVDMGSNAFIDGMKSFGFDEKLPIDYPITQSHISNDGKLDEILLANTSYGQGQIELSSLHMALAYTPFINDGNMIKPSLLKDDKKGEIWKKDLLSKEDADKMNAYLRAIVEEGTATKAKDKELAISGKTGTAELKLSKDSKGHQHGWFVGYPTDDEDILIAMMVEKAEDLGGSGYVAEKVKDVLKKIEEVDK